MGTISLIYCILIILIISNSFFSSEFYIKKLNLTDKVIPYLNKVFLQVSMSLSNKRRNSPVNDAKWLNPFQHALIRPDMYIGSTKTISEDKWVATLNSEINKYITKKYQNFPYNEGFERIHIEQFSNAIDNKWRSNEQGISMTKISFTFNVETGECTVFNDGAFIPIEENSYEYTNHNTGEITINKMYPQQLYFGEWLTSTNYSDNDGRNRKTSGRNGLGAKATNIFSLEFKIECGDPVKGKKYVGIYRDNKTKIENPIITDYSGKTGYTKITFRPDFKRFGFKYYTPEWIDLFRKHAYDCAMVTKIPVYFNGTRIVIGSLKSYASLFLPPKTPMIHLSTEDGEVVFACQTEKMAEEDGFNHISFVNGGNTKEGGVHVDKWKRIILDSVRDKFNDRNISSANNSKSSLKVTIKDLEIYFILFVRCELVEPEYNNQTKTCLKSPVPQTIKLTPSQLNSVMKWPFQQCLIEKIKMKEGMKMKRTGGHKKGFILAGKKVEQAAWAGTKKSKECSLYITEGDSAKALAITGRSSIRNGNETIGVFPLRGKVLNVFNSSLKKLTENEILTNLKKVLGLQYGVDYSKSENINQLNYGGGVVLMCDQDEDGFHICGLVLAFFYKDYRPLYNIEYLKILNTPIVRIKLTAKNNLSFYTISRFREWQNSHQEIINKPGTEVRYYKGLATNTANDGKEIFKNPKITNIPLDGDEEPYMILGFSKTKTDDRKEWLNNYNEEYDNSILLVNDEGIFEENKLDVEENLYLADFVNTRLRSFHVTNMRRSLPHIIDGLKESQRKILYGCFKRNLTKSSIKVAQLAGYISEKTGYHHGEASLHDAIINMAQGFVGAHNIPLLFNDGQFGTRLDGGKDHGAPRYIFTRLEEITRYIFRSEDDELLEKVIDDGEELEPKYYVPIIPLILVNGAKGIGTGFSTDIPSYNPYSIIKWLQIWIHNKTNADDLKEYPPLYPWWRNFKGKITIKTSGPRKGDLSTNGTIQQVKNYWEVSELPVGLWTSSFKEWLETLIREKKVIKKYINYSTTNSVLFNIYPSAEYEPSLEGDFKKLIKSINIRNMTALDLDLKGHIYETPEEILNIYCEIRYSLYSDRKKLLLKKLIREQTRDINRYRFIEDVIVKRNLVLFDRDKDDIIKDLKKRKYDLIDGSYDYLLSMKFSSLTKNKLTTLRQSIENLRVKIQELKKKTEVRMWLDDIKDFIEVYKKFLKTRED